MHDFEPEYPDLDYRSAALMIADHLLEFHQDIELTDKDVAAHDPQMKGQANLAEYTFRVLQFDRSLVSDALQSLADQLHQQPDASTQEVAASQKMFTSEEEFEIRMQGLKFNPTEPLAAAPPEVLSVLSDQIIRSAAPMRWTNEFGMELGQTADPAGLTLSQKEFLHFQEPSFRVIDGNPVWTLLLPNDFFDDKELAKMMSSIDTPAYRYLAVPDPEMNQVISRQVFQNPALLRHFMEQRLAELQDSLYLEMRLRVDDAAHERREFLSRQTERANELLRARFFELLWQDVQQMGGLQYASVYRDLQDAEAMEYGSPPAEVEKSESHMRVFQVRQPEEYSGDDRVLEFSWKNPFLPQSKEQKAWVSLQNGLLVFSLGKDQEWRSSPSFLTTDQSANTLHGEFQEIKLLDISGWVEDPEKARQRSLAMISETAQAQNASEFLQQYRHYELSNYPYRERMIFPKDLKVEATFETPPQDLLMEGKFSRN